MNPLEQSRIKNPNRSRAADHFLRFELDTISATEQQGLNPVRAIKQFFILTKHQLTGFIITYLFLVIIISFITKGPIIASCPTCGTDIIATALFHIFMIGITYFLYCWIHHVWKKALRGFIR